jgi:FAD synthase
LNSATGNFLVLEGGFPSLCFDFVHFGFRFLLRTRSRAKSAAKKLTVMTSMPAPTTFVQEQA